MDLTSDILSSSDNKCPIYKAIYPSPLVISTFPFIHISNPDLFASADIGCIFPPCMSTAYGWDTSHRSFCCCRSPRRSFSAWRPCSSSALVSTTVCAEHQYIKTNQWSCSREREQSQRVKQAVKTVFLCFHQSQLRVWRVRSTSMSCVSLTSTNSIGSLTIEWRPTVLRGSTNSPDSWTLSRWWDTLLLMISV